MKQQWAINQPRQSVSHLNLDLVRGGEMRKMEEQNKVCKCGTELSIWNGKGHCNNCNKKLFWETIEEQVKLENEKDNRKES